MFDVIIVGSGPAGVAAAMALRGYSVAMLDVGIQPSPQTVLEEGNFYDPQFRRSEGPKILGDSLQFLQPSDRMVKLRAPQHRFVLDQPAGAPSIEASGFAPYVSYAVGGLANAWGGQLYRYGPEDLRDYPIDASALAPYYDRLVREIGIAGTNDDLAVYYGYESRLLPPHQLSRLGYNVLSRYLSNRDRLHAQGIRMGYPRLAIQTEPSATGRAHPYDNQEFIRSRAPTLYSPHRTLVKLIRERALSYFGGFMVTSFEEIAGGVRIRVIKLASGDEVVFEARKLLLGLGALNSARLVLASRRDYETRLPIIDNPLSYIPFVHLGSLGLGTQTKSYYNQLNLVYQSDECPEPVMGTFYALTGVFNSELLDQLPLSFASNLRLAGMLFPSMLVLHLWYPGRARPGNYLSLRRDGVLNIHHEPYRLGSVESRLIKALRGLGLISHPRLCQYPQPGNSIHYAGTLSMKDSPTTPYQCHPSGLLNGTRNVYVIDGSALPSLASKNHSLTIMANAMRVADQLQHTFSP